MSSNFGCAALSACNGLPNAPHPLTGLRYCNRHSAWYYVRSDLLKYLNGLLVPSGFNLVLHNVPGLYEQYGYRDLFRLCAINGQLASVDEAKKIIAATGYYTLEYVIMYNREILYCLKHTFFSLLLLEMSGTYGHINVNKLDVRSRIDFWCDATARQGLAVDGRTTLHDTRVNGDLIVTGRVVSQKDAVPMNAANFRRQEAYSRRVNAAQNQYNLEVPEHPNNGDEQLYPTFIANFHKGLPHDTNGLVIPTAYNTLLSAIGNPSLFDTIPMGGPQKLVNPLAGVAFDLEGADSHALYLQPAPTLNSAQQAGEAVENYWMALCRDVKFSDYGTDSNVALAINDLNTMSDFRGPRASGVVTPQTLFRGTASGCCVGPYLSQFFYLNCPFGANYIDQKAKVPVPNVDYMTDWASFLNIQNGENPASPLTFQPNRRYMITGRDLAQWVHIDVLFQAYFHAGLILMNLGCPLNPGNPYVLGHHNQTGFGTFGPPYIMATLCEVASRALKAIWFQKWFVHRRLRPEALGGLVDRTKNGFMSAHWAHTDLMDSQAVMSTYTKFGSYLLPQAFPEGSPLHPSYGAGHATVAGACVTILKAMFNTDNFNIPNPVEPDATGDNLVNYPGVLNATGELHKLAFNVALGRDIAGVHWRSDGNLDIGENIAISVLKDHKQMYNYTEGSGSFTFTKFDGTSVTI